MRRALGFATCLAVLLAGHLALACGASFGTGINVDPHQDIIITWKNGVETYVFQPTFCGTATDFGLILPVPAQLSQSPQVVDQQAFTAAATLSEPNKRQVESRGGVGCVAGASDGSKAAVDDTPTVVASGRVGFLDWVQLKADNESAFTQWLSANGYPYSDASMSVFSYYVKKGWYFLAFRISQEKTPASGTVCRALGPVALSFPTSAPVVPSRMAAASGQAGGGASYGRLWWRIFGITRSDAQLSFPNATDQYDGLWYSGAIDSASAPSFAGLAEPGDRLTRLVLSFYADSIAEDSELTLAPPKDYKGTEDIVVHDDAACALGPRGRSTHSGLLSLFGLTLVGLLCWRRWR
jgi:hypothetical protein